MIGYIVGNIYCTFCTDLMFFVVIICVIKRHLLIVLFNRVEMDNLVSFLATRTSHVADCSIT